ncbi:MAG TPA: hypothetical protein VGD84_08115 [Pseudonocardiaceae bacterium]
MKTSPQFVGPQSAQRPGGGGVEHALLVQTEVGVVKVPVTVAIGAEGPTVTREVWA